MKFLIIKLKDDIDEIILNINFIDLITKEKRFDEKGRFNYVEIPNEFNYFIQLKNGDKFKISFEEYEKIKKAVL